MPRSTARSTTWLSGSIFVCWQGAAFAASPKAGVVVEVDGADTQAVSGEIAQALPNNVGAREPGDLTLALASQGIRGSLIDVLAASRTRKQTLASIHKALTESNAAGILAAQSRRGKAGGHDVQVILIIRSQAEPVIEEDLTTGKGETLTKSLAPLLAATLQDVSASTNLATPAAGMGSLPTKSDANPPAGEPASGDNDANAKKNVPADLTTAQIIASAGVEMGTRNFAYQDYVRGFVRGYGLAGMAMGSLGLELYPFSPTGTPVAKDIGLVGRLGYALPRKSLTRDGEQSADTSWSRFAAGLRGRVRTASAPDSPLLGVEATYGQWAFLFKGSDSVVLQTPSVEYKYVRAGADVRIPFGSLSLVGGAGYMFVLSSGPLTDKFPHETVGEVDLRVGGTYGFTPALEARITASYSRFFMSAHPQGTDVNVAGGALDQYLIGHAGVAYAF